MKITFSSWEIYKLCPRHFNLKFLLKEIAPEPDNMYFAIYGKVVEKFFEFYCNNWRKKTPYMPTEYIREKLRPILRHILLINTVDWTAPFVKESEEDIFEHAFKDICNIMESPNLNFFLNTTAEVTLRAETKIGDILSGRLDFVHGHHLNKDMEMIIDGKGTLKIGRTVNKDQLYFYALLYYFHFKKLPYELGFFYYKYNTFVPVELNMSILNDFRARLSLALKTLREDVDFKPTPSNKSCKWCKYKINCADRHVPKKRKPIHIDVESDVGVQQFGF